VDGRSLWLGLLVDGGGPSTGMSGVVGEACDRGSEAVIASEAEDDTAGFAGSDGDRGDASLCGELVLGLEAFADVAELGEDLGGADASGAGRT